MLEKPKADLLKLAQYDIFDLYKLFNTSENGLTCNEVKERLQKFGSNEIAKKPHETDFARFLSSFKNPLIILLIVLATISFVIGEIETSIIITVMVLISICLAFFQESQSNKAAQKLQEMVQANTSVVRTINGESIQHEIPVKQLVSGDIVNLVTGNIIPADIRLISAKNLLVNQSSLTGESLPVEKRSNITDQNITNPIDTANLIFMGSYISSGTATGMVLATGNDTYFGAIAGKLTSKKTETAFDIGVNKFTLLMIKFMIVAAPLIFLINGLSKGDWLHSLLFSLAVTVALTPETLPVIMTVNLSKGALELSKKKVIVKQLGAVQNLGAMNVLCSDKTGTLTQNKVILERHIDISNLENEDILNFAYINSYYQAGLKNLLDEAVLEHTDEETGQKLKNSYKKVDEIHFDFSRRRISVIVEDNNHKKLLICKGAVEEVLSTCNKAEYFKDQIHSENMVVGLADKKLEELKEISNDLNNDGFRVLALAYKEIPQYQETFSEKDEKDLTIIGFVAFLDPPKESVKEAITELNSYGIEIKILTGDNALVTQKVCKEVGLGIKGVIQGDKIENLSREELFTTVQNNTIFAKLTPLQKEKIVEILHKKGDIVGFLGDGINDGPALKAADVGISVNTAVDIAKESADIILLEKNLLVIGNGVIEGRKVFGNVMKYIKSKASTNFGNMLSLILASSFLPFLPMLPIQIITNNLLSDFSNITIPTDKVDQEYLIKPRAWQLKDLKKTMVALGSVVTVFDFSLFVTMIVLFKAWTKESFFQTGWFVEFILIQVLMIYVVRTDKISFVNSFPSTKLMLSHIIVVIFALWLPYSPLSSALGFIQLPISYFIILFLILFGFSLFTHLVKKYIILQI